MHKLKLLASGVALAGFSTVAAAAPEFYLGAQVGYQDTDVDTVIFEDNLNHSASGVSGGIFAGAKFQVSGGFFIAPEVNLGSSAADGKMTDFWVSDNATFVTNFSDVEIESGKSYGLAVLFGKDLHSNTTLYGRIGYQWTDYKISGTQETFFNNAITTGSFSEKETFGGVRYGFGISTALTEEVNIRADWSQTRYSDEGDEIFSIDPTESLFQVGVSYSF